MSVEPSVRRWSTDSLQPAMRFDCWMGVISESLWPVTEWRDMDREDFSVELRESSFGRLTLIAENISAHESRRTRRDIERSHASCYHLFVSLEPSWGITHHGHRSRMRKGDVVLVDSNAELETRLPTGFNGLVLQCPTDWLQTWLPDPAGLAGQLIPRDSRWGRILSPVVTQLLPEIAVAPPLPHTVMVDQIGAVLALIAGDAHACSTPRLLQKIRDITRQRCNESQLTAIEVASSLNVPPRYLHRLLASRDLTFASLLLEARVDTALAMLQSSRCDHLSMDDIRQRAGFLGFSTMVRVIRKRTGMAPAEVRLAR